MREFWSVIVLLFFSFSPPRTRFLDLIYKYKECVFVMDFGRAVSAWMCRFFFYVHGKRKNIILSSSFSSSSGFFSFFSLLPHLPPPSHLNAKSSHPGIQQSIWLSGRLSGVSSTPPQGMKTKVERPRLCVRGGGALGGGGGCCLPLRTVAEGNPPRPTSSSSSFRPCCELKGSVSPEARSWDARAKTSILSQAPCLPSELRSRSLARTSVPAEFRTRHAVRSTDGSPRFPMEPLLPPPPPPPPPRPAPAGRTCSTESTPRRAPGCARSTR